MVHLVLVVSASFGQNFPAIVAVCFPIFLVLAVFAGRRAEAGGSTAGRSFLLTLLLGPLGYYLVCQRFSLNKDCSYCAETIKAAAIVCPRCHRDLPYDPARRP